MVRGRLRPSGRRDDAEGQRAVRVPADLSVDRSSKLLTCDGHISLTIVLDEMQHDPGQELDLRSLRLQYRMYLR